MRIPAAGPADGYLCIIIYPDVIFRSDIRPFFFIMFCFIILSCFVICAATTIPSGEDNIGEGPAGAAEATALKRIVPQRSAATAVEIVSLVIWLASDLCSERARLARLGTNDAVPHQAGNVHQAGRGSTGSSLAVAASLWT